MSTVGAFFTWRWLSPAVLLAGAGVVLAALGHYWGANPGYADRFLIILAAAGIAWHHREEFRTIAVQPCYWLGQLLLLLGSIGLVLGIFLLVQIGSRTLLLWWLMLSWLVTGGGWLLAEQGAARLRFVAFPLLVILFALPIPLRVLNPLQDQLQSITTSAAYEVFKLSSLPVERQGYVLTLPGGQLGVEEACSGVRSITALTALAAFLAYYYGFGPARGVLLVVGSVPIIALVNILRVVLCGYIQEVFGPAYIVGAWHEALGFALVFVGLGCIIVLAICLDPKSIPTSTLLPAPMDTQPIPSRLAAFVLSSFAILGGLIAYFGWFNLQQVTSQAPLHDIPLTLGSWAGEDRPVPDVVIELLRPDVKSYRIYRTPLGQEAHVWAFAWNSGSAILGYHHPDVCWGNRGFAPAEKWSQPISTGSAEFPLIAREMRQQGVRQTIFYWTQEGGHIWTEQDEAAAFNDMLTVTGSGHRWVLDLLGWRATERGSRVTVLIMLPGAGPIVRQDAVDLTRRYAAELHRVAPWSQPVAQQLREP